ncbi:MAG TPA: beta-ketoacyl synthase N-terminal-like domain-containing protein [Victivallales bacterium]|nr:beta-ketoacyl synthase N-terminal-like domain-containing protein [Victivallales bacterium]
MDNKNTGLTERSLRNIQKKIIDIIASKKNIAPNSIDIFAPFFSIGLRGSETVQISEELSIWLRVKLAPTVFYNHPNINDLSKFLSNYSEFESRSTVETKKRENEKIAIIGIGCRFPGANNANEYWDLLKNVKCAIRDFPKERIKFDFNYDKNDPSTLKLYKGGYIDNIDQFDPLFFGISPKNAEQIDPQHRILLEVASEAFEDAGIRADQLSNNNVGVFVGIAPYQEYFHMQIRQKVADIYSISGTLPCLGANRISYVFNLKGPNLVIDTACSSSLVAIHQACRSIQSGESSLAIAGGVTLLLSNKITGIYNNARLLAPDGRCKAFDKNADGYARGEGAGIVVLKPLSKALADNDYIYAVVSGTATNHGGKSNGITAPNQQGQEAVLREAYMNAGIHPNKVNYIEAHGTATVLGDPIEARALGSVVSDGRKKDDYCLIGSVKTNIGHLEWASGIASLIKVCLILKEKQIPPSLHFKEPNPYIGIENFNIKVQTELSPWPEDKEPIAGVNSIGLGGINAHVVLESADKFITKNNKIRKENFIDAISSNINLFLISARSKKSLIDNIINYNSYISNTPDLKLNDICYSASLKKNHYACKLGIICKTKKDLLEKLKPEIMENIDDSTTFYGEVFSGKKPDLVFLFPDKSKNWMNNLIKSDNSFFSKKNFFVRLLQKYTDIYYKISKISLLNELQSFTYDEPQLNNLISDPLFFLFQLFLVEQWKEKGVSPDQLLGHGQGEITAGYLSGLLTIEDAFSLIYHRASLLQKCHVEGRMLNVMITLDELNSLLKENKNNVHISAINTSSFLSLAGGKTDIELIEKVLLKSGYHVTALSSEHPLYCPEMSKLTNDFWDSFTPTLNTEQILMTPTSFDNTGSPLRITPSYWADQLSRTINFSEAVSKLISQDYNMFIEMGVQSHLSFFILDIFYDLDKDGIAIPSAAKNKKLDDCITEGLAKLYTSGYPLNWENIVSEGNFIKLPSYAWQNQSYWI